MKRKNLKRYKKELKKYAKSHPYVDIKYLTRGLDRC